MGTVLGARRDTPFKEGQDGQQPRQRALPRGLDNAVNPPLHGQRAQRVGGPRERPRRQAEPRHRRNTNPCALVWLGHQRGIGRGQWNYRAGMPGIERRGPLRSLTTAKGLTRSGQRFFIHTHTLRPDPADVKRKCVAARHRGMVGSLTAHVNDPTPPGTVSPMSHRRPVRPVTTRRSQTPSRALKAYLAELGRRGGTARARRMTKAERSASARLAARARWATPRKKPPG